MDETTDIPETTQPTESPPADLAAPGELPETGALKIDGGALFGEPADTAGVVPEAYALTAPEGLTLDADTLAEADPVFRELGLGLREHRCGPPDQLRHAVHKQKPRTREGSHRATLRGYAGGELVEAGRAVPAGVPVSAEWMERGGAGPIETVTT